MSTTATGATIIGTITGTALIGASDGAGIPGTVPDGAGTTAGVGAILTTVTVMAGDTRIMAVITDMAMRITTAQEAPAAIFLPEDAIMPGASMLRQAADAIQAIPLTAQETIRTAREATAPGLSQT